MENCINRTRLNYFGRINYGFSEKYLVEMVWRYDASYIFPEDSRWGFFPGISAGWVMSEENFMQSASFVDRLKLRGSWGQLGNDRMDPLAMRGMMNFSLPIILDLAATIFLITQPLQPASRLQHFPIANPNITWEVANNSNIGLEGTLFEGKISFEVDYFNNIRYTDADQSECIHSHDSRIQSST